MYKTFYKNGHLKPRLQFYTLIILVESRFQHSISSTSTTSRLLYPIELTTI